MSTAAGRAAKLFVDGLIEAGDVVVVCTTKPDKYDRYLADVFIRRERGAGSSQMGGRKQKSEDRGPPTEMDETVFLNNALLEAGHAVRYDGVGPKVEGEG